MESIEKRRHVRVQSLNLSHIARQDDHTVVQQGMGRTLNVSESGILMETTFPLDANGVFDLSLALADDLLEIRGKCVYCTPTAEGRYEAGIEFVGVPIEDLPLLRRFIASFRGV
jgi:PilZ domain